METSFFVQCLDNTKRQGKLIQYVFVTCPQSLGVGGGGQGGKVSA